MLKYTTQRPSFSEYHQMLHTPKQQESYTLFQSNT